MLEIRTPGSRPRNLLRASAQKPERRIGALIPRRRLRSAFQALGRGSVGGVGEVQPAVERVDVHPQARYRCLRPDVVALGRRPSSSEYLNEPCAPGAAFKAAPGWRDARYIYFTVARKLGVGSAPI